MSAPVDASIARPKDIPSSERKLRISNISGSSFPPLSLLKLSKGYYVVFECTEKLQKTEPPKRTELIEWNHEFTWNEPGPALKLKVYAHSFLGKDSLIFESTEPVESLRPSTVSLARSFGKANGNGKESVIRFTIDLSGGAIANNLATPDVQESMDDVEALREKLRLVQVKDGPAVANFGGIVDSVGPISDALGTFFQNVGVFMNLMDTLSTVHPYAEVAWKAISLGYKIVNNEVRRREKLRDLIVTVDDTCQFIVRFGILKKDDLLQSVVDRLIQQTLACGHFIADYLSNGGFWSSAVENALEDPGETMDQYRAKFLELMRVLGAQIDVKTQHSIEELASSVRHLELLTTTAREELTKSIEKTNMEEVFKDFHYAGGAKFRAEKICLEGTRVDAIERLIKWANRTDNSTTASIFWIKGVAGSGKSTLAHTLGHYLESQKRLGSSFFFDAARQADHGPTTLIPTIALDLADRCGPWRKYLYEQVADDKALRTSDSISEQFTKFLLQPAKQVPFVGPILLIIDGLDESGDQKERADLLKFAIGGFSKLPSNFRILVTSRPEEDINDLFSSLPPENILDTNAISQTSQDHDIRIFIENKLSSLKKKRVSPKEGVWEKQIEDLVKKSEGLFEWARLACDIITQASGLAIDTRFEYALNTSDGLYGLYDKCLTALFLPPGNPVDMSDRVRQVLGCVMTAEEPLTFNDLVRLLEGEIDKETVESIIRSLGSLLSAPANGSTPIKPLHTSFRDFLNNKERSTVFYVDPPSQHASLALFCLRVMNRGLKFNIFGFRTSHEVNEDVKDLKGRIMRSGSHTLSYACRNWAMHLVKADFDEDLASALREFCEKNILSWLEVVSLISKISYMRRYIRYMIRWFEVQAKDRTFAKIGQDIENFVFEFEEVIKQSVPHTYLSALACCSEQNWIKRQYRDRFPNLLTIESDRTRAVDATEKLLYGTFKIEHPRHTVVACFSPDSRHVVSANDSGALQCWDWQSGSCVWSQQAHGNIEGLLFSSGGTFIASASQDGTIQVHNPQDGKLLFKTIDVPDAPYSLAISPDQQSLASGTKHGHIYVYNANTGELRNSKQEAHRAGIDCVAFSQAGRLVSTSSDGTMRLWDIDTLEENGMPFRDSAANIWGVCLSRDGFVAYSCFADGTVRAWDLVAQTEIWRSQEPEINATNFISVTLSADERYLASSARNGAVRLWDPATGHPISESLPNIHGVVSHIKFSADGKYLIGGSQYATIHIWNVEKAIGSPPSSKSTSPRLPREITYVVLSPDSKFVAFGGMDLISIWDRKTGESSLVRLTGGVTVGLLAFSADGQRLAYADSRQTIGVWHTTKRCALTLPLRGHSRSLKCMSWSPDGMFLVSSAEDGSIIVWDITRSQILTSIDIANASLCNEVIFSHSMDQIISAHVDGAVRLWRLKNGQSVGDPLKCGEKQLWSMALSPNDHRTLAAVSGNGTIYRWNTETATRIGEPISGHNDEVNIVTYSHDGRKFATGSDDYSIRIWDTESGEPIGEALYGCQSTILTLAFSADGNEIVSVTYNGLVFVWDISQKTPTPAPSKNRFMLVDDGWAYSLDEDGFGDRLFWLPYRFRAGLATEPNLKVISLRDPDAPPTQINLDRFVHGEQWTSCRASADSVSSSTKS
ncbi:WD40 repeat-like protein [Sistotremastrum suecicum HHB10207 ss-3]|uniref:WD40 repeat-like protein n=1 Tax=Sistotremastrum suecicum HHB10207 ss-3 TaxID=1314776 RepID=A0A165ZDE7_9AGAM|nr:WD40 repeat-like protein [Sistotremastrum suecicum HHB10207 ss-3]